MYLLGTTINDTAISFESHMVHIAAKTKCKALDTVSNLLTNAGACGEVSAIHFCVPPYSGCVRKPMQHLQDMAKHCVFIDPERPGIEILDNLIADIYAKGEDTSSIYYIVDAELFDDIDTKMLSNHYALIQSMCTVHCACCLVISRDTRASDPIDIRIQIDGNNNLIVKSGKLVVTTR